MKHAFFEYKNRPLVRSGDLIYYGYISDPYVAMLQVAPMDSHGFFSFGPQASHLRAVCDVADKIIVEVNENMPRCLGGMEDCIHISEVDMIVQGDNPPMAEMGSIPATDVDRKVAETLPAPAEEKQETEKKKEIFGDLF